MRVFYESNYLHTHFHFSNRRTSSPSARHCRTTTPKDTSSARRCVNSVHFCVRNPAPSRRNTQAFFSCRWMRLSSVYSNCRWCRCSPRGLALAGDVEVVSHWKCVLWWHLGCSSMGRHSQSLCQRKRSRFNIR